MRVLRVFVLPPVYPLTSIFESAIVKLNRKRSATRTRRELTEYNRRYITRIFIDCNAYCILRALIPFP